MKKVIYNHYGTIEDLQLVDVEIPTMQDDEVLIKVKSVAINPLDWKKLEGQLKIITGKKFPKGIAFDFSGIIEKKGSAVGLFQVGDAVFGALNAMKGEALAEYIVVKPNLIYPKPSTLSFEQTSAMISVGSAAIYLFQSARLEAENQLLINGASGGVGLFALQMALKKGIKTTAVASGDGLNFIKKWNPHQTIDYKHEQVLQAPQKYHAIFELAGTLPYSQAKSRLLKPSVYVSTLPNPKDMLTAIFTNLFSSKKHMLVKAHPTQAIYKELCDWTSKEGVEIIIAKAFSLNEFKEAYRYAKKGGLVGKVVFTL